MKAVRCPAWLVSCEPADSMARSMPTGCRARSPAWQQRPRSWPIRTRCAGRVRCTTYPCSGRRWSPDWCAPLLTTDARRRHRLAAGRLLRHVRRDRGVRPAVPAVADAGDDRGLRGLERRRGRRLGRRRHLGRVSNGHLFGAMDAEEYYDFQVNRPTVGWSTASAGRLADHPLLGAPRRPARRATSCWCAASSPTCAGSPSARSCSTWPTSSA